MKRPRLKLDDGAAFVGIVLGLPLGALLASLRLKRRGAVLRGDLTRLGAASGEMEMEAALEEAKREARARLDERD